MKKINEDGTLKGYEFSKGYDPEAPPVFIPKGEDLIDFPCSPTWVRHYANQGLTTDYPPEFYLDKKTEPIGEVSVTHYTGRYTELPALGRLERRLKELETIYNINNKGVGRGKGEGQSGIDWA